MSGSGKSDGGKKKSGRDGLNAILFVTSAFFQALAPLGQGMSATAHSIANIWGSTIPISTKLIYTAKTIKDVTLPALQSSLALLQNATNKTEENLLKIFNEVTFGMAEIYQSFVKTYEEVRTDIVSITSDLADTLSIFNEDLSDRLLAQRDELLELVDEKVYWLQNTIDTKLQEFMQPFEDKVNEILAVVNNFVGPLTVQFNKLDELISKTFLKPNIFSRDTLTYTGLKWGTELFNDIFYSTTPPMTTEEKSGIQLQQVPLWLQVHKQNVILAGQGSYADVAKRIQEEMEEILTGKYNPLKTEIIAEQPKEVTPHEEYIEKESGGAGGHF